MYIDQEGQKDRGEQTDPVKLKKLHLTVKKLKKLKENSF